MSTPELRAQVERLYHDRTPFVLATVVRAERPTSAKPGDSAVVLADGSMDGFVGGICAESTVRLEGLRLLRSGESELLRVTPDASPGPAPVQDGVRVVNNPCLSGGTLEIFLEAVLPPVLVQVFGESPVSRALARVGAALELDVISVAKIKSIVEKGTGKQAAQAAARSRQAGDAAARVTAARFARDPREFATATGVRMQVLPGGDTSGA